MITSIQRFATSLRAHGLMGTIAAVIKRPLGTAELFCERVRGRRGLEIGGPSPFFRTFLPIYECVKSLDNCVFANTTIWEGEISEPFGYHPGKHAGRNYIADGGDLHRFADASYDFVLSCHNLEHIANPVKALKEWIRVTKPGGCIILVLPDYRRTFDRRRSLTSVRHMLDDYASDVGEDDQTHLEEILAKHDFRKDPRAGTWETFRQRSLNNVEHRALHHHVFNPQNTRELLSTVGLQVEVLETTLPHHIAALGILPGGHR
jgi:SAM-dependent methyltransferase